MPTITYQQQDGTSRVLNVAEGSSVMQGAVDNNVPNIRAECGGACACATCMVCVDPEWQRKLPAPAAMELSMLDDEVAADGMQARLSCQIKVTPELDGLVVHVPLAQY